MTLAIRGAGSAIAREFMAMPAVAMESVTVARDVPMPDADRYLFAAGFIAGKRCDDQSEEERQRAWRVNYTDVRDECDRLIDTNDRARICVIGSEAGFVGSYDETYAATKAKLHHYVRNKRLRTPEQQLVCIAPGIIEDTGMTLRRTDTDNLERKRLAHPKQRFLKAVEVARLIYHVLYVDEGYLSGVIIRMNGGGHIV